MKEYLAVLKNYATFSGRARRREYWMFQLINILIFIGLWLIGAMVDFVVIIAGLYMLAMLVPSLAVSVRRLHDTGRSGWWILLNLVPFVGGIIVLVFMCLDSAPGDNTYGSNPKGMTTPVAPTMPAQAQVAPAPAPAPVAEAPIVPPQA